MALDFSSLKKSSGGFDKLMKEVEKIATHHRNDSSKDDRFWQPEVDKAGNGYAVIRFLPPSAGEELPWVRIWNHGFKGPTGKWYIENSLTTLGKADPVSELNTTLWNSGIESDKEIVRNQKRRLTYIANILVVKDPAHPENEGKVFLYKFGKKIFDKIKDVMQPQFEDEEPVNPFDFWKGANFKLRIRTIDSYPNYEQSLFDVSKPLSDDDNDLEMIWKKQYSLKEFVDHKNFKTYEELKSRLDEVLGEEQEENWMKTSKPIVTEKPTFNKPKSAEETEIPFNMEDDDADLEDFKKLALG